MGPLKVTVRHVDDDTLYRTTETTLGPRTVRTPLKVVDRSKVPITLPLPAGAPGVNEIYRSIQKVQLSALMGDQDALRAFTAGVRASLARAQSVGETSVTFLQLDDPRLTTKEMEFVADLEYTHTDVVVVPLIEGIHKRLTGGDDRQFKDYLDFVKKFVAEVEELNHKPVLATIPPLPWILNEKLCDAYLGLGLRAFCVDFAGRTPSAAEALNLRPLLKRFHQEHVEEEVLLYAINASIGKATKGGTVLPAKDILSFGFSFDILGLKHMGLKGPREMYEKMKTKGDMVRVFDKETCAYRMAPLSRASAVRPSDTAVPLADLRDPARYQRAQAVVNIEQQVHEAVRLRRVIEERTVDVYLGTKQHLDVRDRGKFRAAKQDLGTKMSLDGWS